MNPLFDALQTNKDLVVLADKLAKSVEQIDKVHHAAAARAQQHIAAGVRDPGPATVFAAADASCQLIRAQLVASILYLREQAKVTNQAIGGVLGASRNGGGKP